MNRLVCSKMNTTLCLAGILLACGAGGLRSQPVPDAIAAGFYPPELVRQAGPALGLTEEQQASMKQALEKAQERLADLQRQLKEQTGSLTELVKKETLDETAVLAQADKLMNLERDLKRAQLELLIKIKNSLNVEQQAKLRELKAKMPGLSSKMRELQELAQQRRRDGGDLSALEQTRSQLQALVKEGKTKEAEELLDKTIKQLSTEKK